MTVVFPANLLASKQTTKENRYLNMTQ